MKNKYDCFRDGIESYLGKENGNNNAYFSKFKENDLTKEELDEYIRKKSPLKLMTDEQLISFISQNRDMVAKQAGLIGYGTEIWGIIRDRHINKIVSDLKAKAEARKNG